MAEYDEIAEQYRTSKLQPWRLHLETFTLLGLVGDLAGKTVLDLACGEGFYSRLLRQGGAARVVGVDLSGEMIRLAREEEERQPLGVEYVVGDAAHFDAGGGFDLVVATYLFNYARSGDEMLRMCRAAYRSLKPSCRLVAVNNNQDQPVAAFESTRKYGLIKRAAGELREGTPITYTLWNGEKSFEFDNYYLPTATQEWAFRSAGFRSVRWHQLRLSPAGAREYGAEYWSDFLRHPPVVFIECEKPADG
jgi:SAM-dependent methyltransferase